MVIMTLLFGWTGYYRFHKKQYGLGVLYLFTFGLFGLGWLVDIFAALKDNSSGAQSNENTSNKKSFQDIKADAEEEVSSNANKSIYEPFETQNATFLITDSAIILNGTTYPYEQCGKIHIVSGFKIALDAYALFSFEGTDYKLCYKQKDCNRAPKAFEFANNKIAAAHGEELPLYSLISHLGTELLVYEDYISLTHVKTTSSMLDYIGKTISGGSSGAKKIDIDDIISIQHREPAGLSAGFIQFAFHGSVEYRGGITSALNDENSILYDTPRTEEARAIVQYLENKRKELKKARQGGVITQIQSNVSPADELKKYKALLDNGVITQEEFNAKKRQILGL